MKLVDKFRSMACRLKTLSNLESTSLVGETCVSANGEQITCFNLRNMPEFLTEGLHAGYDQV